MKKEVKVSKEILEQLVQEEYEGIMLERNHASLKKTIDSFVNERGNVPVTLLNDLVDLSNKKELPKEAVVQLCEFLSPDELEEMLKD